MPFLQTFTCKLIQQTYVKSCPCAKNALHDGNTQVATAILTLKAERVGFESHLPTYLTNYLTSLILTFLSYEMRNVRVHIP